MTSATPPADPAQPSGGAPEPVSAPPSPQTPADNNQLRLVRKALAAKEKELEALRQTAMSDQEKAIAAAKAEGANEWRTRYLAAAKTNAVLSALTAKGVVAPELAIGALNLSEMDIDEVTGSVDKAALDARIDEVIKRYPMLTASQGSQPATSGTGQRQVTGANLVTTNKDGQLDARSDAMLRWALGGKQPD